MELESFAAAALRETALYPRAGRSRPVALAAHVAVVVVVESLVHPGCRRGARTRWWWVRWRRTDLSAEKTRDGAFVAAMFGIRRIPIARAGGAGRATGYANVSP